MYRYILSTTSIYQLNNMYFIGGRLTILILRYQYATAQSQINVCSLIFRKALFSQVHTCVYWYVCDTHTDQTHTSFPIRQNRPCHSHEPPSNHSFPAFSSIVRPPRQGLPSPNYHSHVLTCHPPQLLLHNLQGNMSSCSCCTC